MAQRLRDPDVRAVFFDAVGTTIYPDPPAPEVYAAIGRRHGSRLTADQVGSRFRSAFGREEGHDQELGLRTSEARERERWQRIVAAALPDVADPDSCFAELFEHFGRPEAWRCAADAGPTLARLADAGLVLGLASNYDCRLRRVVAGQPALARLQHLVISSEVGWRKPAPHFFTELCRAVALPPGQLLLVGDDPVNDIAGARAAGLHAVYFDPDGRQPRLDVPSIRRLGELLALIQSL